MEDLLLHKAKRSRAAIGAAYQSVLVAVAAAAGASFLLDKHLAGSVAGGAWHEPDAPAAAADEGRVLPGGALEEAAQLAGLVQLPHLVGSPHEAGPDEELREGEGRPRAASSDWSSRRSEASMDTSRSSTATRSPRSTARTAAQSANVRRTPRSDVVYSTTAWSCCCG